MIIVNDKYFMFMKTYQKCLISSPLTIALYPPF